ncbi:hypothetical protein, partial [Borreliella garinii]|uniref:hypothetical protein n=1 Tax=Borreliella garinii TaxID=29519 RepID=UPI001AEFC7C1
YNAIKRKHTHNVVGFINYNPYLSIVFRGIKNISDSYFPDVKYFIIMKAGIRMMLPLSLLLINNILKKRKQ